MELYLADETLIKDVQKEFNDFFPCLQLQFFQRSETANKQDQKLQKAGTERAIKKFINLHAPIKILISNKTTVAALIHDFKKIGLTVQVCRKSGNQWVETSLTDDWTLERQNKEADLLRIPTEIPEIVRNS